MINNIYTLKNGKNRQKKLLNNMIENEMFNVVYDELENIVKTLFKWENLPDTIDEKYIEDSLFENGKVAFYKNPITNKIYVHDYHHDNEVNMYGYGMTYHLYSRYTGDIEQHADNSNVIEIHNNTIKKPSAYIILPYAYRMANISMTMDININAQKTPLIFETDKDNRLSVETMYDQWQNNKPVFFVKKSLDPISGESPVNVIKTDAPFVADKMFDLHEDLKNEILTLLGVNNANVNKKERLIIDEVNSNIQEIMINAESMFLGRQRAVEKINKEWGTNIKVKFRINDSELNLLKMSDPMQETVKVQEKDDDGNRMTDVSN